MRKFAIFLLMSAAAGCANGPATPDEVCLTLDPIRPTVAEIDAMSDETVLQILAFNEWLALRCR